MIFTLACDTYVRLALLPSFLDPKYPEILRTIYLDGNLAVSTNVKLAAIEKIEQPSEYGKINIIIDPVLIEQCKKEKPFNSMLIIDYNPLLNFAITKTSLGYQHPTNIVRIPHSDEFNPWQTWREWLPDKPVTKTRGAMFINAETLYLLSATSVSGRIEFPEFIDSKKPVILRDRCDEKWFGLFMPNIQTIDGEIIECEGAKIPDWFSFDA